MQGYCYSVTCSKSEKQCKQSRKQEAGSSELLDEKGLQGLARFQVAKCGGEGLSIFPEFMQVWLNVL